VLGRELGDLAGHHLERVLRVFLRQVVVAQRGQRAHVGGQQRHRPLEPLEGLVGLLLFQQVAAGLGLHLADRVAALHRNGTRHGHVELANAGGATFHLLLPE
jgi:hypothetical protein